jgi:hypothetical protein
VAQVVQVVQVVVGVLLVIQAQLELEPLVKLAVRVVQRAIALVAIAILHGQ